MKAFRKIKDQEQGMTLIEIILAIVLLSIVALATFSGLQYAYVTMAVADDFSEDLFLNQEHFEQSLVYSLLQTESFSAAELDALVPLTNGNDTVDLSLEWDGTTTLPDFSVDVIVYTENNAESTYLEDQAYLYLVDSVLIP